MISVYSIKRTAQCALSRQAEKTVLRHARAHWVGSRRGLKRAVRRYMRDLRRDRSRLKGLLRSAATAAAAALLALQLYAAPVHAQEISFEERTGADNPMNGIFEQTDVAHATNPRFVDLDGDGDLDLPVGDTNGSFLYFENTGDANNPVFTQRTGQDNPMNGHDVGSYSTTAFGDIDGDGDLDLLSGSNGGEFFYFENTGDAANPAFTERTGEDNPMDDNSLRPDFRSVPSFVDLDDDGDLDILSGSGDGIFYYFENTGDANNPVFTERTGGDNPMDGHDVGQYAKAAFADLDNDGDLEILSGSYSMGKYFYFENTGDAANPAFTERTGEDNPMDGTPFPNFENSGTSPAFGDLDGDGDFDILSGSFWGNFFYFENTTPLVAPATLSVGAAFVAPGGEAVIDVSLETSSPIAGVQFKIQPVDPPEPGAAGVLENGPGSPHVVLTGIINDLENQNFSVAHTTDENGVATVLLFNTGGGFLDSGQHTLLELIYEIDEDAPFDHRIDLALSDVVLSNPDAEAVPPELQPGAIHIALPGDVGGGDLGGGDGVVDVLDIVKEIRYVLGILPAPADPGRFFQADPINDGVINVQDVVWMINRFLHPEEPPPVKAVPPVSPVVVSLGALQTADGTAEMVVPISIRSDGAVAAMQATLTFDPNLVRIGEARLTGRAAGFSVQQHVSGGEARLVVYSPTGAVIPSGSGATVLVPVTLLDERVDASLNLGETLLADRNAAAVPSVIGAGSVSLKNTPTRWSLSSSSPNPFNPSTTISYEIPQQAHVTLTVYNLLGQEVIRLVDGVQQPGRYEVVWRGRNARGIGVASGVYLYRITTDRGFTKTRRMTLLK